MRLLECLFVDNDCYKKHGSDHITPTGITVHSTDLAGGILRRFVQPAAGQSIGLKDGDQTVTASKMLQILGTNPNGNSWNRPGVDKACHAMLGKCADGTYAACKTLDYTQPCWGGAFGPNGSYDGRIKVNGKNVAGGPLHIQFEMIEDGASPSKAHAQALYDLAVDYCVYLCKLFPTIKLENIVSHKEAHGRGRASNHGDPESYWQRSGLNKTMNDFRKAVKTKLEQDSGASEGPLYRVQIGSFRNRSYAEAYLAEVKKIYPDAYITVKEAS